jgi:hypothetical protein
LEAPIDELGLWQLHYGLIAAPRTRFGWIA